MEVKLTQKVAWEKFNGKTIRALRVEACNQLRFNFSDGTEAVLHLECGYSGLPRIQYCDGC